MKRMTLSALAAALVGIGIVGCTPQAREQYSEAGQKAQQATADTGKAMKTDAQVTGEVAKDAAHEAGKAIDNTGMTGQVRAAFANARDLHLHDLNVDTVGNTIHLKGRADTENDKKQAEELAKATAGNQFTVSNELTVGKP